MITLTRLNGQPVLLNCDLIETVEQNGETVITLTTGNAVVVRDTLDEVEGKVLAFKRRVYGPAE